MISIPREICRDLSQALTREWIVTNGRGSYASSTIAGARTRRYHGLLIAALQPPLGRTLLLAKINEEVEAGGQTYRLGTDEYPNGVVQPEGYLFLQDVQLDGIVPRLTYRAASFSLDKTIWMERGRDTTYVRYELAPDSEPVNLTLLPLCAYRDFHAEMHGNLNWNFAIESLPGGFRSVAFEGAVPLRVFAVPGASFTPLGLWYWHFELRAEAERGLDSNEDLYLPGLFRAHLEPGQSLTLAATIEPDDRLDLEPDDPLGRLQGHRKKVTAGAQDDFEEQLFFASDQFLVSRPRVTIPSTGGDGQREASTVIAGYHWFGDWGRDTMISLEGLTLTTGRFQTARDILLTFAQFVSEGMLPNRFPDVGDQPEYNTVDATLWYFHAIDRYLEVTHDRALLKLLYPVLREVVEWHVNGTRYNIRMDPADSLLGAGAPDVQLTWMDVKLGDWVVNPRSGKPVEVNALWYNALCLMRDWAVELGEPDASLGRLAEQVALSYEKFWYAPGGYLYDVIDGPEGNSSLMRPNQVFALSLRHTAIPSTHARSMMEGVSRELLTPYGLRTLSPRSPGYQGHWTASRNQRDEAYHNGTVWPWLMGAYIDAHRRVYADHKGRRGLYEPFQTHLKEAGLGTISECFEGDRPHRPVGCIAQAWSVAEILRSYRIVSKEG